MSFQKVALAGIIIELLLIIVTSWLGASPVDTLQLITRFSGRLSLIVYSVIFITLPNGRLANSLFKKPYAFFALLHGIHLIELLLYIYLRGTPINPVRIAGGFIAYVLVFLLPVLSHYHSEGKINKKIFNIGELVAQYYIWMIFFITYLSRVLGKVPNAGGTYQEHLVLFLGVILILVIKIARLFLPEPVANT